jgi:DNA-binding CsgD family transcriptional regulator/tetratricopeptide (TPR) repeat protein
VTDATLLERSGELSLLSELLGEVADGGGGRLVFIRGEAGIGKTSLLRSFSAGLDRSARVVWAACEPLLTPRPYGPLLDIATVVAGEFRAALEAGAEAWDLAVALARELGRGAATVLVFEDLHWADAATVDVLRVVCRRIGGVSALIVMSYREEELDPVHPLRFLLGELPGQEPVTRLALPGLSSAAVAQLAVRSGLDAEELFRRTGGNPFYVTEALAAGTERVPASVRDAVLARAAGLSASAREVLEAIAVVPQETEVWLLEALVQGHPEKLEECLRSGMLRAGTAAVAFRHELARLAIEGSLAPDRRVVLHRRALAALEKQALGPAALARLVHHAEGAGDTRAVLRLAPEAARHAAMIGAHREAADQYARALRFADGLTAEDRIALLEPFAEQCELSDTRTAEALAALEEALAIHRGRGEVFQEGETQVARGRLMVLCGQGAQAEAALLDAVQKLEQAPPGRELARAYASLSIRYMRASDGERTIEWGRKAIELGERAGDAKAVVMALNSIGVVEASQGMGVGKLQQCLDLAERAGLWAEVGRAYNSLCSSLGLRGEWDRHDRFCEKGIEYCQRRGLDYWLRKLESEAAESALAGGRWDEAAAVATQVLAAPSPANRIGLRANALVTLALVRVRRGDPDGWPLLDDALEIAETIDELQFLTPVACARAEAAWLEGRREAIAPATGRAFALALERPEPELLGNLALWRWRAGLLSEAPAAANEPYGLQIAGDWRAAYELWQRRGCMYEAALCLGEADGEEALRRAFEQLAALGARPAAAIVARRLRKRGATGIPRGPRPRTRANPAGLTSRELEILPLLIDGLRNREIAERLVVTPKTVDHHVSAILRKLDIRNRAQASAAAARLGICEPVRPARLPTRIEASAGDAAHKLE